MGGVAIRDEAEAVLLNRAKLDALDPVTEAELAPTTRPPLKTAVDARSKDLTGDVLPYAR